jgi:hypothetical protein
MHWRHFFGALCCAAAPLGAQIRQSDVPPTAHSWLGVDAGIAIDGSAFQTKATFAFNAEIGSFVAPNTVLMVDALLLIPPMSDDPDCGVTAGGETVCGTVDEKKVSGLSGSIGRTWGRTGDTPRLVVSVGAGGYQVNGLAHVAAGADAAARWTIHDWGHLALVLSAQGIVLPNVAGSHVWIVPITVGLRSH